MLLHSYAIVLSSMRLAGLPLEIQVDILRLCSPKDLAVFSRVNISLRHVAEHVLYSHIEFSAGPAEMAILSDNRVPLALKEDRSLLHTLTAYPQKASIVKTFYVELETTELYNTHTKALQLVLIKLAEALGKMSNLIDFRVLYLPMGDLSEGRISEVIRDGHFRLHTLFLEYYHDLDGIIVNNPHLQILGIHYTGLEYSDAHLWTKIKALHRNPSRRRTMPWFFC
ncbi:hypothetical protein F5887DRAFT_385693 [Amanita rubescens]|nr:hypothetical protein F5887DRAFT_385693 [Amanita rubescens]